MSTKDRHACTDLYHIRSVLLFSGSAHTHTHTHTHHTHKSDRRLSSGEFYCTSINCATSVTVVGGPFHPSLLCPLRFVSLFVSASPCLSFLVFSSVLLLTADVEGYCCRVHFQRCIHTRQDFSGRGIGPSQRPLLVQDTRFATDKHPCPGGTRTRDPNSRAAADRRLRRCCYRHWPASPF